MNDTRVQDRAQANVQVMDPPFAQSLFGNTIWSWLWLIVRLYVGWSWLEAGIEKFSNPAWTQTGTALQGFWKNAITQGAGTAHPAIAFDWYRAFIQGLLNAGAYTWFAKLIVFGELVIGVALILGAFTGLAAFFGGFLNWNFMMAGSASINPVLFTLSILLILAWKTAGWIGLDRFLLPALGTPWRRGNLFGGRVGVNPEVVETKTVSER